MKMKIAVLILLMAAAVPALAQHEVTLNWAASSDAATNPSLNYNVYRLNGACPASGVSGFTKIASAVTSTSYVDETVTPGKYCYYATSVLSGAESVPSNAVSAVILPAAPTSLSISKSN